MEERLQKLLSAAGLCSRRTAEEWIAAGRVTVNGAVAAVGDKADIQCDVVAVDGMPLSAADSHTYIMLHKPRGYVTTLSDEKGRKTVAELLKDCPVRVWPVGRLDMDSEGLLLMTNDGDLTHRLTHPSHMIQKEYHVKVTGDVERALPVLSVPMVVDGGDMSADLVEQTGADSLTIVIHQGKNRQVRRMCAAAGLTVTRLIRVREGGLELGELKRGYWRPLNSEEVELLK
jgi:23S rRNA pseudouridine2605 synthase